MLNKQSEKVIKGLISDNDLLNSKLNIALNILNERMTTQATTLPLHRPQNNLQLVNVLLSRLAQLDSIQSKQVDILAKVNSPIAAVKAAQARQRRSRTVNELMADEALEQLEWVKTATTAAAVPTAETESSSESASSALDRLEILIKQIKQNRAYKFGRLYQPESINGADIMLNVCNKCKGDIKTV